MRFTERRFRVGLLVASCLAFGGCGGGGESGPSSDGSEQASSEPLVLAAALPTDETDSTDPGTGNPFGVPDPDAPSAEAEPPIAPDGEPEDVVYCD